MEKQKAVQVVKSVEKIQGKDPGTGRIRILHVIDSLPREGAEILLYDLLERSDRSLFDFRVVALARGGSVAEMLRLLGVEVVILGRKSRWDARAFLRLCRLIRRERIGIVHSHIFSSHLWGALAGRLSGARVLRTEHNMSEWKTGWRRRLDRLALGLTARVIAVSEPVRVSLLVTAGLPPEKVQTVPNGLNLERLRSSVPREEKMRQLGLDPLSRFGVISAALTTKKGHCYLLEALAQIRPRLPDFRMLLLGEGELRGELDRRISELGLRETALLLGSRPDAPQIVAAADLFVLSSTREGLSIAMLEAMALGRPVVATAVGGAPDVIEHGRNGLLVPPGDPVALGRAIETVLGDPDSARRLGAAARETVLRRFGFERMVERYREIYLGLARRLN